MVHFSLTVLFSIMGKCFKKHFLLRLSELRGRNLPSSPSSKSSRATFWKYRITRTEVGRAACFPAEAATPPQTLSLYSLVCNKTGIKSLVPLQVALALPTAASPPTPQVRKRCGRASPPQILLPENGEVHHLSLWDVKWLDETRRVRQMCRAG